MIWYDQTILASRVEDKMVFVDNVHICSVWGFLSDCYRKNIGKLYP